MGTIRLRHKTASVDRHRKASPATPRVQSQHPVRDHDVQLLRARPDAAGDLARGPRPCLWPRAGWGKHSGSRHPHLWWKPTRYQSATSTGQEPKEAAAAGAQERGPMRTHSRAQRPPSHTELVCDGGLCAGFQGDRADAVTIAMVATVHCPSALHRKAAGCGRGAVGQEHWESWI